MGSLKGAAVGAENAAPKRASERRAEECIIRLFRDERNFRNETIYCFGRTRVKANADSANKK